jgi:hypothetical protein
MFAVFHKKKFKGLWHNQKSDIGWLSRTCSSLAWNSAEVEAYWYEYPFNSTTIYIFDEDKNLLIQGPVTRERIKKSEIEGEQDTVESFESWETIETWVGEKYLP